MRTDGLFTINATTVECDQNDYVTLVPFGDVHYDSPQHAHDVWADFKETVKGYHNPVFLGMGDYMDGFSTSERRVIYSRDLHESTLTRQEEEARARIELFSEEIDFMRGRLLGLMGGNHFAQFSDGTTGDQYLARLMNADYLGCCTALRLTLKSGTKKASLDIFAHHGKGGGQTAGGTMNAVEKMDKTCDADIYLMGDNHARGCLPLGDRMRLESGSRAGLYINRRKQWIGRTGSFLYGYTPGERSYVTDAALRPASLGWISFRLKFVRTKANGPERIYIDIRGES